MTRYTYILIPGLLACLFARSIGQEKHSLIGIGASFGDAYPVTDLKNPKDAPLARAFFRYYPVPQVAIETGVGLGTLEAGSTSPGYFSTSIYPVDARLLIIPIKNGKLQPFFFGGAGLLFFNPKDQNGKPLPGNASSAYSTTTTYFPLGFGGQVPVSENTTIGLSAAYNKTNSANIGDATSASNDAFWSISLSVFTILNSGSDDWDGDGLLNDDEMRIGTDPRNPDTDGDGLTDGDEVHRYRTDPLNKDTDGDGLTDGEEVLKYHTDPLNKDTDGDGLTDGEEVLTYHTDPLNKDTDGDGLTDGEEVLTYHTDPLNKDTDGDGLTDGDEVLKYHTDPLNKDTDGDGLTDGDEVLKYKTDPRNPDTDGGGMPDGKEIQLGLNPLDPSDDVPIIKVGERIILEGVNFETAKTTLLPSAKVILDQVAASLLAYPSAEVAIHGHTDNVGGAKYNMQLSIGRAESVKKYLAQKGVSSDRITTKGFGFTKPIADNATAAGRAKNRRIEFVRVK